MSSIIEVLKAAVSVLPTKVECSGNPCTLIGIRIESDLTNQLEFYVRDEQGKRYWVTKAFIKFL